MADEQDEVLRFLEGGALGGPVERIATHGAIVLLAGERAFKLKRPVKRRVVEDDDEEEDEEDRDE